MRTLIFGGVALGMLLSCNSNGSEDCTEFINFEAFFDLDGDGFGADSAGLVCTLEAGMVEVAGDCDDTDATIFPGAEEICNGRDDNCLAGIDDGFELTQYWYDEDRDGYGSAYPSMLACAISDAGWVENSDDCDDLDPDRNPDATEICNGGIDDDCDRLSEESDPDLDIDTQIRWYQDLDADGYGNPQRFTEACLAPSGYVDDGTDCNDTRDTVHPDANEICNEAVDDDCDNLADDDDPSLDPASLLSFFEDADGDGFGNPGVAVLACAPDAGRVDNDLDCNDADAAIAPSRDEIYCDLIDNDCDPLTSDNIDSDFDGFFFCTDDCNDHDDAMYPGAPEVAGDGRDQDCNGYESCYSDVDNDGYRTDVLVDVTADAYCSYLPNARPELPIDCDDNDPSVVWSGNWLADGDQDGVGFGVTTLVQCADPGAGFAPEEIGQDCDDADPAVSPIAIDPCDDGFDWNCDGTDTCLTCKDILEAGGTTSDTYTILPLGVARQVWCDQTTDGGGWTLVGASNSPLDDRSGPYYDSLEDLSPSKFETKIWDGLRQRIQTNSDIRFACNQLFGGPLTVDLSFYDNAWYMDFTTGIDADSCFYEGDGAGAEIPPARRNNANDNSFRPYGDQYAAGFLEGEDTCDDQGDFAVDFDERGNDGALWDVGDWGESQFIRRCETKNVGSGWFLFVRELD